MEGPARGSAADPRPPLPAPSPGGTGPGLEDYPCGPREWLLGDILTGFLPRGRDASRQGTQSRKIPPGVLPGCSPSRLFALVRMVYRIHQEHYLQL